MQCVRRNPALEYGLESIATLEASVNTDFPLHQMVSALRLMKPCQKLFLAICDQINARPEVRTHSGFNPLAELGIVCRILMGTWQKLKAQSMLAELVSVCRALKVT